MNERYTGFHSTIREIAFRNPSGVTSVDYLEKRYGPKAHGFMLEQTDEIINNIETFLQTAAIIGIPVVRSIGYLIPKNGHPDRFDLAEYVPNVGPNLLQVIEKRTMEHDTSQASSCFVDYLRLFKQVWDTGFRISLDPPLTNFCIDCRNNLWYVDCMPPRQQLPDGSYISEWPVPPIDSQKFIIDRYFSPHQARVIYAQALRSLLALGFPIDFIKSSISETLGKEAEDAIVIDQEHRRRLFLNPQPTDVDLLRIVASEAYGQHLIDQDGLKTVYKLCHIGIGGILPTQEEVENAGKLLHQVYDNRSISI